MYLVGEITGPNKSARHSFLCTLNESIMLIVSQSVYNYSLIEVFLGLRQETLASLDLCR